MLITHWKVLLSHHLTNPCSLLVQFHHFTFFCFSFHRVLFGWCCNITWQLEWFCCIQVLYCSFQIQFSSSQSDRSHFAIFFRIYTSVMIPSFDWALLLWLPFIKTIFPTLTSGLLLLCFNLCLLRNDVRYSFLHPFHADSLHLCIHLCLFYKSLFSLSVRSSLGITGV